MWNEHIPSNLNYIDYSDPNDLFEAMMYRTLDYWSYATDNYNDILNNFNGIVKTAGYKLQLKSYAIGLYGRLGNVTNADYQMILNRPMPGINFNIGINFYLHTKTTKQNNRNTLAWCF